MAERLSKQAERIKQEIKDYEKAIEILESHNDSADDASDIVGRKPIHTLIDVKRKLEQKL